jgi:hypothetical protein
VPLCHARARHQVFDRGVQSCMSFVSFVHYASSIGYFFFVLCCETDADLLVAAVTAEFDYEGSTFGNRIS